MNRVKGILSIIQIRTETMYRVFNREEYNIVYIMYVARVVRKDESRRCRGYNMRVFRSRPKPRRIILALSRQSCHKSILLGLTRIALTRRCECLDVRSQSPAARI